MELSEVLTETSEVVVEKLTPEQWQHIYSIFEKIDLYADYVVGLLVFIVLVIVMKYCYKFFKIFI